MDLTAGIISFIILYFGIFTAISYKLTAGYDSNKLGFIVANRNAGLLESSLAAGASWVLGLALFASSGYAYNFGWAGLFWFAIPQTIGLFIFAWFSRSCNRIIPEGYTISGFIQEKFGTSVSSIYQLVLSLVSLGFIILTFTALTKFLIFVGVPNVPLISGLIVIGTLAYALKGGLKTNLVTGSLQMIFILLFCIALLILAFTNGGVDALINGINGKQNYSSLFDEKLLTTFGIAMALTSITGIVGNQSYYQKSFGQQENKNSYISFIIGGFLFAVVPITLGTIGLMAYGSGIAVSDPTTAHLAWMQTNIGMFAVLIFGFIVLQCAANALDASGNAFGAIVAHDWIKDESRSVLWSRISIIVIAVIGWLVSTLNLPLTYIFLTYGVLRVTLFIITMLAVKTDWLKKQGIVIAVILIAPIAFYLNTVGMKMEAAILGFFITPTLALLISRVRT
jgi:Na+/proline symporter